MVDPSPGGVAPPVDSIPVPVPGAVDRECPGRVRTLPVDRIRTSYRHLRPGALIEAQLELADLPLRVVPTDDGHYEILDGFKRFRSWSEAGYRSVPVVIEPPLESLDRKRLMLLANTPARSITPLDEARIVESLIKEDGLTHLTVSHLLGRKRRWVTQRFQMATRLSNCAQEALGHGRIGPSLPLVGIGVA